MSSRRDAKISTRGRNQHGPRSQDAGIESRSSESRGGSAGSNPQRQKQMHRCALGFRINTQGTMIRMGFLAVDDSRPHEPNGDSDCMMCMAKNEEQRLNAEIEKRSLSYFIRFTLSPPGSSAGSPGDICYMLCNCGVHGPPPIGSCSALGSSSFHAAIRDMEMGVLREKQKRADCAGFKHFKSYRRS